jgi:hypothetical protein
MARTPPKPTRHDIIAGHRQFCEDYHTGPGDHLYERLETIESRHATPPWTSGAQVVYDRLVEVVGDDT